MKTNDGRFDHVLPGVEFERNDVGLKIKPKKVWHYLLIPTNVVIALFIVLSCTLANNGPTSGY